MRACRRSGAARRRTEIVVRRAAGLTPRHRLRFNWAAGQATRLPARERAGMHVESLYSPLPLRPEPSGVASDCRFVPIDRSDPRWGEPLVDVTEAGLLAQAWYARTDGRNEPYNAPIAGAVATVAARTSVIERLVRADAAVAPLGLRIKTLDAYRSVETQAGLWAFFWDKIG